eukprot:GGOE01005510.1.p1 GENE.GGOE01005510.1~~GGOE01005510.1.p1  ORF type:complete len:496 (-),score=30.25 GGOE01005510.1:269-1756(-)
MEEAARLLECYRIEGGPAPMAIGHAPATDCYGHAMNIMSQLMVEVQEREQQLVEAIHHGQNLLAELCRLKNPSPVRSPLRSTAPPATSTPSAVHSPPSLSPPSASQCGCLLLPLTSPSKRLLQSEMSRMTKAMQGKHVAVAEWARRCDDLARHLERSEAEKDGAVAMCQRLQDHLRRSEAERCELEAAISELEWSNAQLREEGCRLLAVLPVRDESPPSRSTCSVATWTDPASALQTAETTVSSSPLSSEESPHSLDTEMQLSSPQQPGSISPFSSAGPGEASLKHRELLHKLLPEVSPGSYWPRRLFAVEDVAGECLLDPLAACLPEIPQLPAVSHHPRTPGKAVATSTSGSVLAGQRRPSHSVTTSTGKDQSTGLTGRRARPGDPPPLSCTADGDTHGAEECDGICLIVQHNAESGLLRPRTKGWPGRLRWVLDCLWCQGDASEQHHGRVSRRISRGGSTAWPWAHRMGRTPATPRCVDSTPPGPPLSSSAPG